MAEKTGGTEKLIYPFNTAGVMEVYSLISNDWYRVTSGYFRSYDGKRRITEPTNIVKGNTGIKFRTYDYEGPVFMWGTNFAIEDPEGTGQLVSSPYLEELQEISNNK